MNQINGLSTLSKESIDLCFFDPPYNAKKDYGVYKDNLLNHEYIEFMKKTISECSRISKKGIAVYVDCYRFKVWFQEIFPKSYPIIIWKRSPGFSNEQKIYSSYHIILTNIKAIKNIPGLWHDLHPVSDGFYWRLTKDYVSKTHPAQTSLEIVERFITNFTIEGDLILDPFMGTGSTAEACKKLNRRYIGYEINEEYKQDIDNRLKNCRLQPKQHQLEAFVK